MQIYVPTAQNPWFWSTLSVRTHLPPETMQPAIAAAVARVDKNLALTQVRTIDEIAAQATAQPRFRARLVALFAALALIVAAVGVAGLLAFSVQHRRRELALRMAAFGVRRPTPLVRAMNVVTTRAAPRVACGAPAASGRLLFTIPWHNRLAIGTWHGSEPWRG